jgi:hypothetical protein
MAILGGVRRSSICGKEPENSHSSVEVHLPYRHARGTVLRRLFPSARIARPRWTGGHELLLCPPCYSQTPVATIGVYFLLDDPSNVVALVTCE